MEERIIFKDQEHKDFLERCLKRVDADSYHRALFYALGICAETREHIDDIYDFEAKCINIIALSATWQSSGTKRICRLAFNLFNGFHYNDALEPDTSGDFTPYELFAAPEAKFMIEAVKIRHYNYMRL